MDKPQHEKAGCGLLPPSLALFIDDEGGYTSVSFAMALLVSFTLVFSMAAAAWALSRSAEVQAVADAAALSASQVTASYSTIVQVLDAAVQTLGISGMLLVGAGMIASAVPGGQAAGSAGVDAGIRLLRARSHLVETAAEGLERLEAALPLLQIAAAKAAVDAAGTESIEYAGLAIPYPLASQSDFSHLGEEVDAEGLEEATEALGEASERVSEAQKEAESAKEEAWRADCVQDPWCLRERASSLAGLEGTLNPDYPVLETWTFGAPLLRARAYYAERLAQEAPEGEGKEEEVRSAIRRAYYRFAAEEMQKGSYSEGTDGSVSIHLPSLPHTADETRASGLYSLAVWPVSDEEEGLVIHAFSGCPGAEGTFIGVASLAELEEGLVLACPVCGLDVSSVGQVASATTNTASGFEHYWRIIVEASKRYQKAMDDEVQADAQTREVAKENASRFDEALEVLETAEPQFCPPGAWGCVAFVARSSEPDIPATQTSILSQASLPAGAAISAAVLAPDESTEENSVLSRFAEGWEQALGEEDGLADSILDVWSMLLEGYGAGFGAARSVAESLFDGVGGVFGGSAAAWLRERLGDALEASGLDPSDLRLRKPVLTSTHNVFARAGLEASGERERLASLLDGDADSTERAAAALGIASDALPEDGVFQIAEILIPGARAVPLEIDLGRWL